MHVKMIRRENLRRLAKSTGGISCLARKLNKAQSQVSHLIGINPVKQIGDKMASQIEAVFDKPRGWLDSEHYSVDGKQMVYRMEGQLAILSKHVPLISWQTVLRWYKIFEENLAKVSEHWVKTTAEVGNCAFSLSVYGDSMESSVGISFYEGMIIIADPDQVARIGDFVIVRTRSDKEAALRQLVSDGHKKYLKPLNTRYPIVEYWVDTMIYGVVKQVILEV